MSRRVRGLRVELLWWLLGASPLLAQESPETRQGGQGRSTLRGPAILAASAVSFIAPALSETSVQARPDIADDSTRKGTHRHRALRFPVIGAAMGGVVGAVWVGERATTGTSEASLSRHDAHVVGSVIGVVIGGAAGALIHFMTRAPH